MARCIANRFGNNNKWLALAKFSRTPPDDPAPLILFTHADIVSRN